jgi:hypothetical protein
MLQKKTRSTRKPVVEPPANKHPLEELVNNAGSQLKNAQDAVGFWIQQRIAPLWPNGQTTASRPQKNRPKPRRPPPIQDDDANALRYYHPEDTRVAKNTSNSIVNKADLELDSALKTVKPGEEYFKDSLPTILKKLNARNQMYNGERKRKSLLCFKSDKTYEKILSGNAEDNNRLKTLSEVSQNFDNKSKQLLTINGPSPDDLDRILPVGNQLKRLLNVMDAEKQANITTTFDSAEQNAYTTLYRNLTDKYNLILETCKLNGLFRAFQERQLR